MEKIKLSNGEFVTVNPDNDECLNPQTLNVGGRRTKNEYFIHNTKEKEKILYERKISLWSDVQTTYNLVRDCNLGMDCVRFCLCKALGVDYISILKTKNVNVTDLDMSLDKKIEAACCY